MGEPHRLNPGNAAVYDLHDRWQDQPWDKPYYSSAFTECILNRPARNAAHRAQAGMITFEVAAPMVQPDEVVAIAGAAPQLGAWDTEKAVRLSDALSHLVGFCGGK